MTQWFNNRLLDWGRIHRRSFPWRETHDPWRVLVAEILLQRSRGQTVAKVYEELFRRWPDASSMSRAHEGTIAAVIHPLGLVRRAGTLRAAAKEVARLGRVPGDFNALVALPGVGRYAASATLVVAFGKQAPVVDGVSARVYRRFLGLHSNLPATSDRSLWEEVARATPPKASKEWNWAVLDLAAEVCLPANPRCGACPLVARCAFPAAA